MRKRFSFVEGFRGVGDYDILVEFVYVVIRFFLEIFSY